MHSPVIFMFSGQGSQYYHMGRELFHQNPIFKKWILNLNEIVTENTGRSVVDELYNEKKTLSDRFDQLTDTHPAIFMVEYALARVLIENGLGPDYVLGASLGEFTAAAVAGIIPVEKALESILKQAELVTRHCKPGNMIAIIHSPDLYHTSPVFNHHSELAGVNYPSHFVISGAGDELSRIEIYLKTSEILFQTLPVRYGFHSANIDPIKQEYQEFLSRFSLKKSEVPMISSVFSKRVDEISPDYFWNVIREPIQFQNTIAQLEEDGNFTYIDLGPSGTLANFVKYNLTTGSQSKCYSIMTPFHQEIKSIQSVMNLVQK